MTHDAPPGGACRVLTVTPNPSLDLLFETDRLVWDDANRMPDPRRRPGGQGINVARAMHVLGGSATAVALLGGRTGAELEQVLRAEGIQLRTVPGAGETRTFVAVRQRGDGASLLLNARGPARSPDDVRLLEAEVLAALADLQPGFLACCGSLPDGFPPDFYHRLARAAAAAGIRVVVDCDGEPLRLAAPACDVLVPNQHEAQRLSGRAIHGLEDAAATAHGLRERGTAIVCITLGAAGAVLADGSGSWHATAPPAPDGSTVGAGDTFLAGLLCGLGSGAPAPECLRDAVAAATAVLGATGAALVDRDRALALRAQVKLRRLI